MCQTIATRAVAEDRAALGRREAAARDVLLYVEGRRRPRTTGCDGYRPRHSDVEVEGELVRMRPQPNWIHLILPLVLEPRLDQVRREDVALQQEVVVLLQGV